MPGAPSLCPSYASALVGFECRGRSRKALPFGVRAVDRHLPGGGLALDALHEVMETGAASEHAAAATLFIAGILARNKGPVLWCVRLRDLFAPALAAVGLHPDRVIYAETHRESEVLAAAEEGLRHKGLAGVVAEVARLASRRRARVRTREGADGTGRAHDRSGQSAGEDRACQPRLQHEANDLAHRPSRPGIGGRRRQDAGPTPIAGSQATDLAFSRAEPTRAHPSRQGSWRCPAARVPAPTLDDETVRQLVQGITKVIGGALLKRLKPAEQRIEALELSTREATEPR
jgi:hypothetical protein